MFLLPPASPPSQEPRSLLANLPSEAGSLKWPFRAKRLPLHSFQTKETWGSGRLEGIHFASAEDSICTGPISFKINHGSILGPFCWR